jgi:hypothetical protein
MALHSQDSLPGCFCRLTRQPICLKQSFCIAGGAGLPEQVTANSPW